MDDKNRKGFNTKSVHAGYHVDSGPVNPPIIESSTHAFSTCADGAARFASKDKEGIYARLSNPTVAALEAKLASLEHGYGGIATASGMAAVLSDLTELGISNHCRILSTRVFAAIESAICSSPMPR